MTFLRNFGWTLLWALVILVLCLLPGKDLPSFWWTEILSIDKFVHAGVFAVLVWLLLRSLRLRTPDLPLRSREVRIALALCIAYGGALEIMQGAFLPDRFADLMDFLANALGCWLSWWWMKRIKDAAAATT